MASCVISMAAAGCTTQNGAQEGRTPWYPEVGASITYRASGSLPLLSTVLDLGAAKVGVGSRLIFSVVSETTVVDAKLRVHRALTVDVSLDGKGAGRFVVDKSGSGLVQVVGVGSALPGDTSVVVREHDPWCFGGSALAFAHAASWVVADRTFRVETRALHYDATEEGAAPNPFRLSGEVGSPCPSRATGRRDWRVPSDPEGFEATFDSRQGGERPLADDISKDPLIVLVPSARQDHALPVGGDWNAQELSLDEALTLVEGETETASYLSSHPGAIVVWAHHWTRADATTRQSFWNFIFADEASTHRVSVTRNTALDLSVTKRDTVSPGGPERPPAPYVAFPREVTRGGVPFPELMRAHEGLTRTTASELEFGILPDDTRIVAVEFEEGECSSRCRLGSTTWNVSSGELLGYSGPPEHWSPVLPPS